MTSAFRHRLAYLTILAAAVTACEPEILVPPDQGGGGAGAAPPHVGGHGGQPTGGDSTGGFGGVGGSGGSEPGPVPGCEALEWAGDALRLPDVVSTHVHLVGLGGGRVGLVYVDKTLQTPGDLVASVTIEDPFGTWPPAMSAPVEHLQEKLLNSEGFLSARPDGAFALSENVRAAFMFGVPGVTRRFDEWEPIMLEPNAGGGAYQADWNIDTRSIELRYFASVTDDSEPTFAGTFPTSNLCHTMRSAPLGPGLLVALGPEYFCREPSGLVELYSVGPDGIDAVTSFEIAYSPRKQRLVPRQNGYWYGIAPDDGEPLIAYALDATGNRVEDPWVFEPVEETRYPRDFAAWRGGLAIALNEALGAVRVAVWNGKNVTYVGEADHGELTGTMNYVPMVVGGIDDRSVLVAYPSTDGIRIRRADCSSP